MQKQIEEHDLKNIKDLDPELVEAFLEYVSKPKKIKKVKTIKKKASKSIVRKIKVGKKNLTKRNQ